MILNVLLPAPRKVALWVLALAVLLNIVAWVLAWAFFPTSHPAAILHYTAYAGIDYVASGSYILVLPLMGLLMLITNSVLVTVLRDVEKRAAWILLSVLPAMQAIILGAIILLWRANT